MQRVRFSCDSYREYARMSWSRGKKFDVLSCVGLAHADDDLDAWIDENLGDASAE